MNYFLFVGQLSMIYANWKSVDLDYILVESDKLYKSLKCCDYLNVDQLPWQVKIFEHTVNLDISEEILPDSITIYGDSFLTDVFTVSNVNTRLHTVFM